MPIEHFGNREDSVYWYIKKTLKYSFRHHLNLGAAYEYIITLFFTIIITILLVLLLLYLLRVYFYS